MAEKIINKAGYTAISRVRVGRGSNAQKSSKKLFFTKASRTDRPTDRPTDGPTDGRTDTPSYRDARTHLKTIYARRAEGNRTK